MIWHAAQELEHLNLALNNVTRVQNLQRCESLRKLDLTANFIDTAALPALHSLQHNQQLHELHLLGNPCTKWTGYRAYVVATVPQLDILVSGLHARTELPQAVAHIHRLKSRRETFGSWLAEKG